MTQYGWLEKERARVPRKKFHIFEPRSLSDLRGIEAEYGQLPGDYREFVQSFGQASLFRSPHGQWHCLSVTAPPLVKLPESKKSRPRAAAVRLQVGHCVNSGYAWLEWRDGAFLHEGAIFAGFTGQRRKAAASFADWVQRSFAACRRLYTKEQWAAILQPVPPFSAHEQQVVDAIPQFGFRKVGVTASGNTLVEVENRSPLGLPCLTIGVRSKTGMTGAVALRIAGLTPGATRTVEQDLYRGSMDPQGIELFRLPLPDPEDRPYFRELSAASDGT